MICLFGESWRLNSADQIHEYWSSLDGKMRHFICLSSRTVILYIHSPV